MKHIVKIMAVVVAISASWLGLLQTSIVSQDYTWLLPIYFIVSLGCYGLLMVGIGLMQFPTCPQEALLLQQVLYLRFFCNLLLYIILAEDILEAKDFLKPRGVDVGSD
ncbi:hypothetical protein RJ639_036946 [Escallonia herrerae]|uniref:Dolichol-phosphate mannosyltransferase subunit 3 n=1 Tax=Escallonia herrerae TaxID=1293975 RepID=A0AA88WRM8_9ASTE|nr:hypothetical protein RJ639_036946 [Escallonia herrerae]